MIFGKWDERMGVRSEPARVVSGPVAAVGAVPNVPAVEVKKTQPILAERPAE
jgi:hypothetical protein